MFVRLARTPGGPTCRVVVRLRPAVARRFDHNRRRRHHLRHSDTEWRSDDDCDQRLLVTPDLSSAQFHFTAVGTAFVYTLMFSLNSDASDIASATVTLTNS